MILCSAALQQLCPMHSEAVRDKGVGMLDDMVARCFLITCIMYRRFAENDWGSKPSNPPRPHQNMYMIVCSALRMKKNIESCDMSPDWSDS